MLLAEGGFYVDWYENLDGFGRFGPRQTVLELAAGGSSKVITADVDDDGDQDIVSGTTGWFASNGDGTFGSYQPVVDSPGSSTPVFTADFDMVGDLDLLARSKEGLLWVENSMGLNEMSARRTIAPTWGRGFATPMWLENRLAGDVDDDGQITFSDFLVVAANFGKSVTAVWADGDFDGNGSVDFADFLRLTANFAPTE